MYSIGKRVATTVMALAMTLALVGCAEEPLSTARWSNIH
jgi:hypothetical protein